MEKDDLKLTDLDYLIGDHHLQMIKAALPYVQISQQKYLSLFVKSNELMRTMELFREGPEGEMGICSVEQDKSSPIEMLNAMKPYGTKQEQDMMDVIINIMQGFQIRRNYQDSVSSAPPDSSVSAASAAENSIPSTVMMLEKLKALLPPEQQSRLENIQLMMQTMQAFT